MFAVFSGAGIPLHVFVTRWNTSHVAGSGFSSSGIGQAFETNSFVRNPAGVTRTSAKSAMLL